MYFYVILSYTNKIKHYADHNNFIEIIDIRYCFRHNKKKYTNDKINAIKYIHIACIQFYRSVQNHHYLITTLYN